MSRGTVTSSVRLRFLCQQVLTSRNSSDRPREVHSEILRDTVKVSGNLFFIEMGPIEYHKLSGTVEWFGTLHPPSDLNPTGSGQTHKLSPP